MPRKHPAARRASKTQLKPKPLAKKLPIKKPAPNLPKPSPQDPFADAASITEQILQHHRTAGAATVEARAEEGALLVAAKQKIPHGSWGTYVQHKLPYSEGTAKRAIHLHHFRESHPALFAKLRPVGIRVAAFLITRPVPELTAFLSKAHLVPSLGVEKTPTTMDLPQVMEVLFGQPTANDDLTELLLTRSSKSARRTIAEIKALIDNRHALDPDDVEELYDDLLHAIAALGVAYGFEKS